MKHVIIAHYFQPGSAATNRIIAYAQGFVYNNIRVSLILGSEKENVIPLIQVENMLKVFMVQAPHGYLLNRSIAQQVKKIYTDNNSMAILIYGSPVLCWFLPRSKYNIFYECTEVPFYGRAKTLGNRIKEEIKVILAKRATGMLVISNSLEQYFRGKGIKSIAVINMFVDARRFDGIQISKNEKYVAYCGTVSPIKDGVDCLIKAFALFHKTHSDYDLIIIGRFESENAEKTLRALVKDLNVECSVRFTGMVKPEEMPSLLCGANMLALARPNNEQAKYGFPTKLGEYLATGKPVIVTNVGEISDFLQDGVNCRMANSGDPEAFALCMDWVADNYSEAITIASKGKELTENEFSSVVQSKKAISFMDACIVLNETLK